MIQMSEITFEIQLIKRSKELDNQKKLLYIRFYASSNSTILNYSNYFLNDEFRKLD